MNPKACESLSPWGWSALWAQAYQAATPRGPVHLLKTALGSRQGLVSGRLQYTVTGLDGNFNPRRALRLATLALAGSSGVGKTTLVDRLPGGALLMDTPGFRAVGLLADAEDLTEGFARTEQAAQRAEKDRWKAIHQSMHGFGKETRSRG